MVTKNTFSASCMPHLDALEEAFSKKKGSAKTTTREKQLFALFNKKLKEVSSARSATASFDELPEQLSDLKERITRIQDIDPSVKKIQDFASKALAKLEQVCTALKSPLESGKKTPRPVFNLNGAPESSSKKKPSCKTPPRTPSQLEILRNLADKDLNISADDQLPFDKQAAQAQGIFGIDNEGGNDCYQNALCQALLTKVFKKDVIDRLPKELRRHFYREDGMIHSQALRKDILRFTAFLSSKTNQGQDINSFLYSQEDAQELLSALLDHTDKNDFSTQEPAISLKAIAQDPDPIDTWQTNIEKKNNIITKLFLYSFFIPAKIFYSLWNKLSKFLSNEEQEQAPLQPAAPIQLPPKTPREAPNFTQFSFAERYRWDVADIPEQFKHHENFGLDTNTSQRQERTHGIIQLSLEGEQGHFNLQDKFNSQFLPVMGESNVGELVPLEDDQEGPHNKITHTAPFRSEKKLSSIPGAFALQVVRFAFMNNQSVKRFDVADDFNPILTISQDNFTEEVRPDAPINMHLQSFVIHKGDCGGGHYVAFRKVDNEWYYFNDKKCEKVKEEAALRAAKHAYLYFFEREDLL